MFIPEYVECIYVQAWSDPARINAVTESSFGGRLSRYLPEKNIFQMRKKDAWTEYFPVITKITLTV
jgi:hypothetical protein